MRMRPLRATWRFTAVVGAMLLLLAACGDGDTDAPDESPEDATIEDTDDPDANGEGATEDEEPDAAAFPELYYPASELFLPDHPIDDVLVDFYGSHNDAEETIAWFEGNTPDFDAFTIEDDEVNGERLWIAERPDAEAGQVTRIEIAHSEAHAELGFIAGIADVLPPGTVIIAIAHAT